MNHPQPVGRQGSHVLTEVADESEGLQIVHSAPENALAQAGTPRAACLPKKLANVSTTSRKESGRRKKEPGTSNTLRAWTNPNKRPQLRTMNNSGKSLLVRFSMLSRVVSRLTILFGACLISVQTLSQFVSGPLRTPFQIPFQTSFWNLSHSLRARFKPFKTPLEKSKIRPSCPVQASPPDVSFLSFTLRKTTPKFLSNKKSKQELL